MKHQDDEPLAGAADVRKAYDALPGNDVPAELDARILARAREAADKPDNGIALKRQAIRRWAIPISAAASVVVVMSVVYELRFSTPHESPAAITTSMEQDAATPPQDERELADASPASETSAKKPASARAKHRADASRANSISPPPPVVAPVVSPPPPMVSLAESAPASPAPVISIPLPSSTSSERVTVTDEPRQESKATEHATAGALTTQPQLLAKAAKQADAKASRALLAQLAGHYAYESYGIVMPSGRVLGLKDMGSTAATLDISAQGTLTLRMTMIKGKPVTQVAKILDVQMDGNSGYWIAQWPDMSYPAKTEISLEDDKLFCTTRFVNPADGPRFGSMEQATLQRIAGE